LDKHGEATILNNLNIKDTKDNSKSLSPFLGEMIEIWVGLSYQDKITTSDSFLSQSLWHNFPISVMDKPIFYKNWQQSEITSENQIVKQKPSIFLAPWEFESMYQTKVYLLVFYGKSSAQKMIWKCHN